MFFFSLWKRQDPFPRLNVSQLRYRTLHSYDPSLLQGMLRASSGWQDSTQQYSGTRLGVLRGIDSVHVLIFGAFVELCCEHKGVLQSWKQWGPADFFCVFPSRFSSGLSLNAHVGFLVPVQWLPSSYSLSGGGCEIWNVSKTSGRKWGGGGRHTALAKRYRLWSAAKALD